MVTTDSGFGVKNNKTRKHEHKNQTKTQTVIT